MDNIIEVKNLRKYYGKSRAIEEVNFNVKPGLIYGFVGPNGAGKSTTIKILLDFIKADQGEALILNQDCNIKSEDIKKDIGYVSSDVRYYGYMTVKDIINQTLKFYDLDYYDDIDTMCNYLQIDTSKKIKELSLGNKKKIAIICALIHNPKLIILDEPTSGLDPLIQKRLFDLLTAKVKQGATVFLSSHNLTEIENHCDMVAFIKEGKIIKIQDLKEESIKHIKNVIIKGQNINKEEIEKHKGQIIYSNENEIHFHYNDDIVELMKYLTTLELDDISINNLSLEEEFMSYYEGDKDENI